MRVAIVDPYFITGFGYQTTGWFRALVAQGHQVRAFASPHLSTVVRRHHPGNFALGLSREEGGEVLRLESRQLPRDVVDCPTLLRHVLDFSPELTLAVYPGTLFARSLFENRSRLPGALVTAFGENSAQRRNTRPGWRQIAKNLMLDTGFFLLKRRFYRAAMEASDAVLLQTPDTFDYLLRRIGGPRWRAEIAGRCVLLPLGFETRVFFPDPAAREAGRREMSLSDREPLVLYACKIMPEKRLDLWVRIVAGAMRQVAGLRALLIGRRDGDPWSDQVLRWIEATGLKDRFWFSPFAARETLAKWCNAADFGLWHLQPAVTIQEAMGTGLYMLMSTSDTMRHLVIDPDTGRHFPEGDERAAEELLVETSRQWSDGRGPATPEARRRRASINRRRFSYEALAAGLTAAVGDPRGLVAALRKAGDIGGRVD